MPCRLALAAVTAVTLLSPAAAQEPFAGLSEPASPDDLGALAETIRGIAADKVLVRDLLGKKVTGTDGETVGTVQDFVVVPGGAMPGGQLVAAIVTAPDGDRLALPFTAVKLGTSDAGGTLTLPFAASEVTGIAALSDLATDLAGGGSD